MICPNCGQEVNGRVCASCGAVIKKKQTGLIVLAIALAVVIATCAVVVLAAPSEGGVDIGSATRSYVTAAYYANKVVDSGSGYASYDDFKVDIDIALDACKALNGGSGLLAQADWQFVRTAYAADVYVLDGLDTDAGSGYYGGYTSGVQDEIDDIMADMQNDAEDVIDALEKLDVVMRSDADKDEKRDAFDDAADALSGEDNVSVVVGNKEVSFAGVKTLGGINTALIGVDIIIDGSTVYLGADNAVLFAGGDIGGEVAVIDSGSEDGVMLDTGNLGDLQQAGVNVVITLGDIGETPEAEVFDTAQAFTHYISDEISSGIGIDMNEGNDIGGNEDIADSAQDTESGVYIEDASVVGTWQYTDALLSPWVTLNEVEQGAAEFMLDIHKQPSEILMYPGKAVEQFLIFRPDGTGILYYDVEGEGIVMPSGFWWRVDDNGDILFVGEVTVGYTFEWNDHLRGIMRNFQNGDYGDFEDINIGRIRKNSVVNIVYLYQFLSGEDDSDVCIEYTKLSTATDFDYEN